jgi:hypothetical protein
MINATVVDVKFKGAFKMDDVDGNEKIPVLYRGKAKRI